MAPAQGRAGEVILSVSVTVCRLRCVGYSVSVTVCRGHGVALGCATVLVLLQLETMCGPSPLAVWAEPAWSPRGGWVNRRCRLAQDCLPSGADEECGLALSGKSEQRPTASVRLS